MTLQWYELSAGVDEDLHEPQGALATEPEAIQGFQVPTDESLNTALDNSFAAIAPRIKGNPTFGDLEWEDPSTSAQTGGTPATAPQEPLVWHDLGQKKATQQDDYGWGISNAFKRGLIRAGQLVDLAQDDYEEYAEGAEELEKYGVSAEDQKRLEELQETDGFWKAIGYYIKNPSLAMQVVAESLPMSVPTLGGALAGGIFGGIPGAVAGGAAGSGTVEYLATIGDSLAKADVDATDPAALRAAFADPEFMAEARKDAIQRGIGVAAFDGLSVGLAGRIYKPIKALTGAATKTGGVLGGTSELLAQSAAGAGGEGAAQLLDVGEIEDPVALASEAVGEIVPGVGEIAINRMVGRDAAGGRPERDVPEPAPGAPIPPTGPGGAPLTAAEAAAIDAEAADQQVETSSPESETATTSQTPTDKNAPAAQGETSSEVVEEMDIAAALKAEAAKEDAAWQAEAEAKDVVETESPLIDTKVLGPKITATINASEKPGPVRTAWRGLLESLAKRYPETAAKVPPRTFNGTGAAAFFKTLQEDVDLTKDLPEIKEFLDGVTTLETAEVIQTLERLTSHVQGTIPSLADAPIDSVAGQVQAEYNNFMAYYENAKKEGKGKWTKGKEVLKGSKIKMANKLGELSGAVRALLLAAEKAGVLEQAGIGANYGKTMELADQFADQAQSPLEKKTASGGKSKTIAPNSSTLLEVANNLKEIAEKVVPLLAEAEAVGTKAKEKAGIRTKVEETSAVTEAPAQPRTAKELKTEFEAQKAATKPEVPDEVGGARSRKTIEKIRGEKEAETPGLIEHAAAEKAQRARKKQEAGKTVEVAGKKWTVKKEKRLGTTTMRWWARPLGSNSDWKSAGTTIAERDAILNNITEEQISETFPDGTKTVTSENLVATSTGLYSVEAPAQPTKEEKRAKRQEAMAALKAANKKFQEDTKEPLGAGIDIKKGKLTPAQRKQQREMNAENRAEVEALAATENAEELATKIRFDKALVGRNATVAQLRKIAKTLGAKGYSKLTRAGVEALVEEQAQVVSEQQQRGVVAEEAAEIQAEVEQHVPKKFRDKHVFHAVRNVKDIASIVKNGLKKGTNIALDIMGQGVSMLGDVGTTVLVFKDDKGAYATKGYQNDGVANGGMKPVAIITDETDAAVISELKKTGLPVYRNGKRDVTITTKKAKIKKPDVKGADPADVFDKKQNITGKKAQMFKEATGKEKIGEAIESLGVSVNAAKKIEGIMGVLDKNGKLALTKIADEFRRTGETVRFVAQVENLVGKVPSPALMEAFKEFFIAINEQEAARPTTTEDALDATYDDKLDLTEKERFIAEQTGAIDPRIDRETTAVDEWNVPLNKRFTRGKGIAREWGIFTKALNKNRNRLRKFISDSVGKKVTLASVLTELQKALPYNHRYAPLIARLKKLDLDVPVTFDTNPLINEEGEPDASQWAVYISALGLHERAIEVYIGEEVPLEHVFPSLMHEVVHAATVAAYEFNSKFKADIDALFLEAQLAALEEFGMLPEDPKPRWAYGLTNEYEFIAEAFANGVFQQWLSSVEATGRVPNIKNSGLLRKFINRIKKYLGYSIRNSLLEEVIIRSSRAMVSEQMIQEALVSQSQEPMVLPTKRPAIAKQTGKYKLSVREYDRYTDKIQTTERYGYDSLEEAKDRFRILRNEGKDVTLSGQGMDKATAQSWVTAYSIAQKATRRAVVADDTTVNKKAKSNLVNRTADAARAKNNSVEESYKTLKEKVWDKARAINLGFMNRDVIERNYRELFNRASKAAGHAFSPLTQYIKAKQHASRVAEEFAQRANDAVQKLQKLDNQTRAKVFALMRDATLAQVWPQVSLRDEMNAHLWSKPTKKNVSKLSPTLGEAATQARKDWVALNKKNPEAANLLIEMGMLTKEMQNRKRIEALRTTGKSFELEASFTEKLAALETKEDVQKLFPGMYNKSGELINTSDKKLRPADTIINKNDSAEIKEEKTKKYQAWKDAGTIAEVAEKLIEGSAIKGPYFPLRRYGKYVVSSTDDHNDEGVPYVSFHNTRVEAERVAAAIEEKHGIPTFVTKKAESMAIARDVQSVVAEVANRLESNKQGHMHSLLKTAMIEIMADNTAYASQLKRAGVDGVAADDMGRAFEEYVFVSKYTLSDITTAYEVHQSLKDLKRLQIRGVQDARSQEKITEDESLLVSDVVNELAAQNKEDARDREMSKFQKGVGLIGFFNFLGAPSYWVLNATQTLVVTLPYIGSKWGARGTAAYTSAAATIFKAVKGAKSYEQFKSNLPPAAQKVVAELEEQQILQSTIAHQFGDILTPSFMKAVQKWTGPAGKATATALKLMETIPEGVEKYNRISTALAIYNLSDGNIQAVADGVQATQFNYDSANRARLMKAAPEWLGGGLRAVITPVMMFKSYGIGLTRLLYGGMMDAMITKRAHETAQQAATRRIEGLKVAGGLIVSHSVFGGVAGGMMMAPVQALVWAFNESFKEAGDEFDPEEAVELYLQDVANDTVAALVARGLPAAVGVDMSKSINLGNLIWMGNDRINMSDAGGVETAMTTALGPVAQWGITSVREGHRLWTDDPRGNWYDFAAAAIPLKMARGTIRGLKYEMEGVGTDTLTFLEPEEVTGWIRSAMGFRPTNIAMTTDYEYGLMARDARRSQRKSQLIDKALRANTPSGRAAVWEDIQSFNRSLERKDYINKGDVARLKSSRRSRQRRYDRERR